jgi:hypothetical protein
VPAWLVVVVAWLVPGAGHLLLGRRQKGLVFLIAVPLMFATGLWLQGRLFPFDRSDLLIFLSAAAQLCNAQAQMTTSHFGLMLLFAFFVSLVFAVIARDQPAEQLKLGAKFFGGFAAAGIVLGWILLLMPF